MNKNLSDSEIRELLQCLKSDDVGHIPSFEDVLGNFVTPAANRSARKSRSGLVISGCTAAGILAVSLLLWSWLGRTTAVSDRPIAGGVARQTKSVSPDAPAAGIGVDFDYLRIVALTQIAMNAEPVAGDNNPWSSPTESLLAVNFNLTSSSGIE